jgi:sugar O-acyltransferase (sialic acid O-acetyltransferase NeuD family)
VRVLIIGAGGHAQVVADILLRMGEAGFAVCPIGYVDDNPILSGCRFLGLPVLGCLADSVSIAHDAVIVAIGDNVTRQRVFDLLHNHGEHFVIARHPHAVLAPDVEVGPGSMICAGVVVNTGSRIGANVISNTGCTVDHHNLVGDHTHIAPGVHTGGEVMIGEGALIGIGATIMPRRIVGPWATVGAGALVSKDVPAYAVAVGAPARVIRRNRPIEAVSP